MTELCLNWRRVISYANIWESFHHFPQPRSKSSKCLTYESIQTQASWQHHHQQPSDCGGDIVTLALLPKCCWCWWRFHSYFRRVVENLHYPVFSSSRGDPVQWNMIFLPSYMCTVVCVLTLRRMYILLCTYRTHYLVSYVLLTSILNAVWNYKSYFFSVTNHFIDLSILYYFTHLGKSMLTLAYSLHYVPS